MRNETLIRLAAIATLAVAGSCSGSSYGTTGLGNNNNNTGSTSDAIDVTDNRYSPSATTVPVGTTVTWTWKGVNSHSVTFDDGPTSTKQTAGSFQRTFPSAGTFRYHCLVHGTAMAGSVTVQ